jgi:surfeit locus 1 family protein
MPRAYSFRPRGWALVLAAVACAAGIALGNWQAGRAEEKRRLGAQLEQALRAPPLQIGSAMVEPEALALKHVTARGRFVAEHTVFLDNKLRRGRPGYEILTPLRLNGVHVLVNRGWIQAARTRDALPGVPTPAGEVVVDGLALARLPHAFELGAPAAGPVRQNLDLQGYAAQTRLVLQPVIIEQHNAAPDGLLREWPRPDAGIEKHESYSLQWYSLAGLAVILFVVLSFRRVAPA